MKPIRYIVRHLHRAFPDSPVEMAVVSYNTELPAAFSYAIDTARRYHGTIYADFDDGKDYTLVRSYGRQSV